MKKIPFLLTLIFLGILTVSTFTSAFNPYTSSIASQKVITCTKFNQNLKLYDGEKNKKSDLVFELQRVLKEKNYLLPEPTGFFGLKTWNAVKKFQKEYNLPETGFVGPKTRGILSSTYCSENNEYSICSYPAPPRECGYIPGPKYDSKSKCGMILSCNQNENLISSNCKTWSDGCNICSKSSPKGSEMCTLRACSEEMMTKPYCREYFDTKISDTCKSWYDGCNSCMRSEIGKTAGCTKIACFQKSESYCKEYFSVEKSCTDDGRAYKEGESTSCLTINGQKACIADATHVCRNGTWKTESSLLIEKLLQVCPSEKIINKMPTLSEEYYIYQGNKKEIKAFDEAWVTSNCKNIPENIIY